MRYLYHHNELISVAQVDESSGHFKRLDVMDRLDYVVITRDIAKLGQTEKKMKQKITKYLTKVTETSMSVRLTKSPAGVQFQDKKNRDFRPSPTGTFFAAR